MIFMQGMKAMTTLRLNPNTPKIENMFDFCEYGPLWSQQNLALDCYQRWGGRHPDFFRDDYFEWVDRWLDENPEEIFRIGIPDRYASQYKEEYPDARQRAKEWLFFLFQVCYDNMGKLR